MKRYYLFGIIFVLVLLSAGMVHAEEYCDLEAGNFVIDTYNNVLNRVTGEGKCWGGLYCPASHFRNCDEFRNMKFWGGLYDNGTNGMQQEIELISQGFVDYTKEINGSSKIEFIDTKGKLANLAGLELGLWKRKEAGSTKFTYGYAKTGDEMGPWILEDILKTLSTLNWTKVMNGYGVEMERGGETGKEKWSGVENLLKDPEQKCEMLLSFDQSEFLQNERVFYGPLSNYSAVGGILLDKNVVNTENSGAENYDVIQVGAYRSYFKPIIDLSVDGIGKDQNWYSTAYCYVDDGDEVAWKIGFSNTTFADLDGYGMIEHTFWKVGTTHEISAEGRREIPWSESFTGYLGKDTYPLSALGEDCGSEDSKYVAKGIRCSSPFWIIHWDTQWQVLGRFYKLTSSKKPTASLSEEEKTKLMFAEAENDYFSLTPENNFSTWENIFFKTTFTNTEKETGEFKKNIKIQISNPLFDAKGIARELPSGLKGACKTGSSLVQCELEADCTGENEIINCILAIPPQLTRLGDEITAFVGEKTMISLGEAEIPIIPSDSTCNYSAKGYTPAGIHNPSGNYSCDLYSVNMEAYTSFFVDEAENYCATKGTTGLFSIFTSTPKTPEQYRQCLADYIIQKGLGAKADEEDRWLNGFWRQELWYTMKDNPKAEDCNINKLVKTYEDYYQKVYGFEALVRQSYLERLMIKQSEPLNSKNQYFKKDGKEQPRFVALANPTQNTCALADLPAWQSLWLGTGTTADYSIVLTTLLRTAGFRADEVYTVANTNNYAYNIVMQPNGKFAVVDTAGNNSNPYIQNPKDHKKNYCDIKTYFSSIAVQNDTQWLSEYQLPEILEKMGCA